MKNVTIGADEISMIHPLIHYVTMTANDQAGPGTQLLTNKREIKVRKVKIPQAYAFIFNNLLHVPLACTQQKPILEIIMHQQVKEVPMH